jgi:hypothetical protein
MHGDGLPVDMSCYLLEGEMHVQAALEALDSTSAFIDDETMVRVQRTTRKSVHVTRAFGSDWTERPLEAGLSLSASWEDAEMKMTVRGRYGNPILETESPLAVELATMRTATAKDGRDLMMAEFRIVKQAILTLRAACARWKGGFTGATDESKAFVAAAHCAMASDIDGGQMVVILPDPFNPLRLDAMMTLHERDPKGARALLAAYAERLDPVAPVVCRFSVNMKGPDPAHPKIVMSSVTMISDEPSDPMDILERLAWLQKRIDANQETRS